MLSWFGASAPATTPVYVFGCRMSDAGGAEGDGLTSMRRAVSERVTWFTYRTGLSRPLLHDKSTDAGWGCTLRSMQMLLANGMVMAQTGGWQRDEEPGSSGGRAGCKLGEASPGVTAPAAASDTGDHAARRNETADGDAGEGKERGGWPSGMEARRRACLAHFVEWLPPWQGTFSIYSFLRSSGRGPRWWGPHEAAYHACALAAGAPDTLPFTLLLCTDSCVALSEVHAAMARADAPGSHASCAAGGIDHVAAADGDVHAVPTPCRPVLVLLPLRLGVDSCIDSRYVQPLLHAMQCPTFTGAVGGTPKHSLFFLGHAGSSLICLDPHVTQPNPPSPTLNPGTPPYTTDWAGLLPDAYAASTLPPHSGVLLKPVHVIDPTLALSFLLTCPADVDAFIHHFSPPASPLHDHATANLPGVDTPVGAIVSTADAVVERARASLRRGAGVRGAPGSPPVTDATDGTPPASTLLAGGEEQAAVAEGPQLRGGMVDDLVAVDVSAAPAMEAALPPASTPSLRLFDIVPSRPCYDMPKRSWSGDSGPCAQVAAELASMAGGGGGGPTATGAWKDVGDGDDDDVEGWVVDDWDDCGLSPAAAVGGVSTGHDDAVVDGEGEGVVPCATVHVAPSRGGMSRAATQALEAWTLAFYAGKGVMSTRFGGGQGGGEGGGVTSRSLLDSMLHGLGLSALFPPKNVEHDVGAPTTATNPGVPLPQGAARSSHDGDVTGGPNNGHAPEPTACTSSAICHSSTSPPHGSSLLPVSRPQPPSPCSATIALDLAPPSSQPLPVTVGGSPGSSNQLHLQRRSFQGYDLCLMGEEGTPGSDEGDRVGPGAPTSATMAASSFLSPAGSRGTGSVIGRVDGADGPPGNAVSTPLSHPSVDSDYSLVSAKGSPPLPSWSLGDGVDGGGGSHVPRSPDPAVGDGGGGSASSASSAGACTPSPVPTGGHGGGHSARLSGGEGRGSRRSHRRTGSHSGGGGGGGGASIGLPAAQLPPHTPSATGSGVMATLPLRGRGDSIVEVVWNVKSTNSPQFHSLHMHHASATVGTPLPTGADGASHASASGTSGGSPASLTSSTMGTPLVLVGMAGIPPPLALEGGLLSPTTTTSALTVTEAHARTGLVGGLPAGALPRGGGEGLRATGMVGSALPSTSSTTTGGGGGLGAGGGTPWCTTATRIISSGSDGANSHTSAVSNGSILSTLAGGCRQGTWDASPSQATKHVRAPCSSLPARATSEEREAHAHSVAVPSTLGE